MKPTNVYLAELLLVIISFFFTIPAIGQDIIITTDGRRIEASVKEIGEDSVLYKLWDNPSGPDHRINTKTIGILELQNGERYVYSTIVDAINSGKDIPQKIDNRRFKLYDETTGLYLSNDYLQQILSKDQYNSYISAQKMRRTARTLTFVSAGLVAAGTIFFVGAIEQAKKEPYSNDTSLVTASALCYVGGAGCLIATIPIRSIGRGKVARVANDYNTNIRLLSLGATDNGIGIIFRF